MRRVNIPQPRGTPNPGGYSPIWPPTRLPGCVAWLDCQETLTQAGTVTSITNMATGTAWTEAVAPPTYEAAGLNGRPCMVGDGAAMKIISTEASVVAAFTGATKAYTLIFACKPVVDSGGCIVGVGLSTQASDSSFRFGTTAAGIGFWSTTKRGTAAVEVRSETALRDTAVVAAYSVNGTTVSLRLNMARETSNAQFLDIGVPAPDRVGLLCCPRSTPNEFWAARLGAAIIYNRCLPLSEENGIVSALMGRWGIPT